MRLYLYAAGLAAVLALGAAAYHYRGRALQAEADRASLRMAIQLRAEQDARQARIREEAQQFDRDILEEPGGDAGLSDFLRRGAGRLWQ